MLVREAQGREASPSAGVVDSQSVKTTEAGGPGGYDAGQKLKDALRPLGRWTIAARLSRPNQRPGHKAVETSSTASYAWPCGPGPSGALFHGRVMSDRIG